MGNQPVNALVQEIVFAVTTDHHRQTPCQQSGLIIAEFTIV